MKKISLLLLTFFALFSLAACGSEALEIELSETFIELELGESQTIDVTTNLEVETSFLSLNSGVATVNADGRINSVGLGSTNIRVTVGEVIETVTVRVVPVPIVEEPEPEVILTAESVRDALNDVTVAYATSLNDAIDALPSSTIVYDDAGNLYVVDLSWAIPGFDSMASPLVETDFVATGSFSLPEGLEPGDISFEVSLTVSVLPVASEVALSILNRDPNSATLTTFIEAGIKEVTASNLNAVKAALVVAKNVTLNPGWAPSDIQAVVDNINLNGGTYMLNLTMDTEGSLDYLELSTQNRYLKFESEMISEPLLAFLELNSDLLDGQSASFDFTLGLEGNTLNRINYLKLLNLNNLKTNLLIVPSGPLFSNLTIDGLNENLFLDLVIGANNVKVRNTNDVSLILVENAAEIDVSNSELISIFNLVNTTVNLDSVMLKEELGTNPLLSLNAPFYQNNNTGYGQNSTFFGAIQQAPYYLFSQLLINEPEEIINTELGMNYNFASFEFMDDLDSGFGGQIFEDSTDVLNYFNSILDVISSISNTAIFTDIYDDIPEDLLSNPLFLFEMLLFTSPTIESLETLRNEISLQLIVGFGNDAFNRYVYLLNTIDGFFPTSLSNDNDIFMDSNIFYENQNISNKPLLTLNGSLMIDDYTSMLGRVDGLEASSEVEGAEFYIYQNSYLSNFSFDKNIVIETGMIEYNHLSNRYNNITLENGSFYNGIYEVGDDLELFLKGNINGNGGEIDTLENNILNVSVGISIDDLYYSNVYNRYKLTTNNNAGSTTISNLDLSKIDAVYVYGPDNLIENVSLGAFYVEGANDDTSVIVDTAIFISSYIFVENAEVIIRNSKVDDYIDLILSDDSMMTLTSDLIFDNSENLYIELSQSAVFIGLEYIKLESDIELLSGKSGNVPISGNEIIAIWKVATDSGIYTELVTGDTVTLTPAEVDKTLRLVLFNSLNKEEVVLETFGLIALDSLYITNSSISLDTEATVVAGDNNVSVDIELLTKNNLDVTTLTNVAFLVTSGSLLLSEQTLNVSNSGTLTFTITEAGVYEDVTVHVLKDGVLSAFSTTFDITVTAATPNAISIISPVNLTQVGAGASYDIELSVEDTYGNPVPNAVVSLSAVNLNDDGSGFAAETMMTGVDGTLTATLSIDPVALPESNISVTFAIVGDSASLTGIELFESVSSDSSASVIDATVVAGTNVEIAVTLIDTKDIPQAITGTSLTMLLVDGNLETGTVVATAASVNYTSTTGTASFAITTVDDYDLNLYVETFEGSNAYVLVQSDLEFEVIAADAVTVKGPENSASTINVDLGSNQALAFTLEDAFGNLVVDEVVEFELTGNSSDSYINTTNTTSGSLTVNANGEYVVNLFIARNEVFDASTDLTLLISTSAVDVSGNAISYSLAINVNNTLDAELSTVDNSIESSSIIAANNNVELIVTLVNVSGDAIDTDVLGVYLEMADNTTLAGVLSGTGVTRTATFTITDTSINTSNLKLFVETYVGSGEYLIIENDLDLEIIAGDAVDITNLTSSSINVPMPGDVFTIGLTVIDVFGNPVDDEDITFEIQNRLSNGTIISGSTTGTSRTLSTNADGFVEWTITIGETEPIGNILEIVITINGNVITLGGLDQIIPIGINPT